MQKKQSVYDKPTGTLFGTLAKGADLMEGILAECERYGIESGTLTCMGSLERATYVHGVQGPDGMPAYSETIVVEGPTEILSGTGFLCRTEEGKLDLHFHGLIVDKFGQIRGGHFLYGKNPVLITIEFAVHSGPSVQAVRRFDPGLGFPVIRFSEKAQS